MTDAVHPTSNDTASSRITAGQIRHGAASSGWIAPTTDEYFASDAGLTGTPLNAFAFTTSAASRDVTVDTGEAFVGGYWLGRDATTTVTLAASTADQTIYVGPDVSAADTVIVGLSSAFASDDPKIAIGTFTTDANGVTAETDDRTTELLVTEFDETLLKDGGSRELDASELAGSLGTNGQVLQTDGAAASWGQVSTAATVQATEPTYSEGALWLDSDDGTFHVGYDDGGGGDFHPVPPVAVLDEAVTFTETDVTLSHTRTRVSGGSVELSTAQTSRAADDSVGSNTGGAYGVRINPNVDLSEIYVGISNNTANASHLYAYRVSDSVLIADLNQSLSANTEYTLTGTFVSGTDYNIVVDNDGSNYDRGYDSNPSFPYTGHSLDIVNSASGKNSTLAGEAPNIRYVSGGASSGEVTIEWGSPTDIEGWDLATFQRTLNGETCTIDVQESSDGGATWSTTFTNIGQNFDISTISEANDVRLKANISRTSTANNPTLDYAAQRYVR